MMIFWTKEAKTRLMEIEEYIAKNNPANAIIFVNALITTAESICNSPEKGRIVPELSMENIRELIYKRYRVVYKIEKKSIRILTVFEGRQLLKREEIIQNFS